MLLAMDASTTEPGCHYAWVMLLLEFELLEERAGEMAL